MIFEIYEIMLNNFVTKHNDSQSSSKEKLEKERKIKKLKNSAT